MKTNWIYNQTAYFSWKAYPSPWNFTQLLLAMLVTFRKSVFAGIFLEFSCCWLFYMIKKNVIFKQCILTMFRAQILLNSLVLGMESVESCNRHNSNKSFNHCWWELYAWLQPRSSQTGRSTLQAKLFLNNAS